MKTYRFILSALCLVLCGPIPTRAQDMDEAVAKLTEEISVRIKENGNKKVTVLDFTDLQGNATELGRYLAEQVTVNFVLVKRDFSVLDRANLRRILDEHKLTSTGLIQPENAKKLGMFAGVDAMIFGTVVPVGSQLSLVVKIITTEAAEVVGGAKTKFKMDEALKQMMTQPAKSEDLKAQEKAEQKKTTPKAPPPKAFGDLLAWVESFNLDQGDQVYGSVTFSIVVTNSSDSLTYGMAFREGSDGFNISNKRGDEFRLDTLQGIGRAFEAFDGLHGSFTDVLPGNAILITGKAYVRWNGRPGDYRPYRIQTETYFSPESQGRYPNKKKINLVLDVK